MLCSTPGPSVSHAGHATAFVGVNEDDASSTEADLDMSHDDYSLVGWRDHVADKVAHYLHSVTTARGRHGGGHVDTIDDLLGLVKSAYVRLVGFTPTDHVASGTGEYELLVPDSQEVRTSGPSVVTGVKVFAHRVLFSGGGRRRW